MNVRSIIARLEKLEGDAPDPCGACNGVAAVVIRRQKRDGTLTLEPGQAIPPDCPACGRTWEERRRPDRISEVILDEPT